MRTLIVYGTRYGATASTSEEIAKVLKAKNFQVNVVNAKEEKVKDISPYDLILVGSGMQMGKWTGASQDFLRKFQKDLAQKKLAIFASTMKTVSEKEGKLEDLEKDRKQSIDDIITKYDLNPISTGFFGGVLDYDKMNILLRKTMGFLKPQLEKDGFSESSPGVYDLRDWEEIRTWANELAQKCRQ